MERMRGKSRREKESKRLKFELKIKKKVQDFMGLKIQKIKAEHSKTEKRQMGQQRKAKDKHKQNKGRELILLQSL